MGRLSISEAARQAGISRQYFYTKFIKTKSITVSDDEEGNKYIDSAELLRACGGRLPMVKPPSIKTNGLQPTVAVIAQPQNDSQIASLQAELQQVREQLYDYKQREDRLLTQVDNLTTALKQIEHKQEPEKPKQSFAELEGYWRGKVETLEYTLQQLQQKPEPPKRGFWAKLFSGE